MNSYQAIATRMNNAVSEFINSLVELGFTTTEAEKIFNLYKKEKIIKLDAAIGRYNLTHGAFWDIEVLKRAANL